MAAWKFMISNTAAETADIIRSHLWEQHSFRYIKKNGNNIPREYLEFSKEEREYEPGGVLKEIIFLLKDLPEEEIEDAIAYYEDYFEEAGEEKEEQVIKELGSQRRSRG